MVKSNMIGSSAAFASQVHGRQRFSRTRVYIADDHVVLRRGVASIIRDETDMELSGESSKCTKAWKEVRRLRPDVVIVELTISGERGIELIKSIKAFDPGICVVVLSLRDESEYAFPAIKAGASAYVSKQAAPSMLIDAIRKARAGRMCVSERVAGQMLEHVANGHDIESFEPASRLSSRELEVFKLIGLGHGTRDIAESLGISIKTVEAHRAHIKEKASLNNAFELLQLSIRWSGAGSPVPS